MFPFESGIALKILGSYPSLASSYKLAHILAKTASFVMPTSLPGPKRAKALVLLSISLLAL